MSSKRIGLFFLLIGQLTGCSGWWGGEEGSRLPGERIAVMPELTKIESDARLKNLEIRLPKPFRNNEWKQAGGNSHHVMHHLAAKGPFKEIWDTDVGKGSNKRRQLIGEPVISDGKIFTIDTNAVIQALDSQTGRKLWKRKIKPKKSQETDGTLGGGISLFGQFLVASTGFGSVICINSGTGKTVWRVNVGAPVRSAPTIFKKRVFVVTLENKTFALNLINGQKLWLHSGISETAMLYGGASPAAIGSTVVVSYSSGELFALRLENGRQIWRDSLTALKRTDPISAIAHIRGRPIIDRGMVIASANSGRTVAIDLRTGVRIWERYIGSSQNPWLIGDFIFLITNGSRLVCLTRKMGLVKWVSQLPRFEDMDKRENPIYWTSPLIAGDRLLIGGSNGEVWSISPYTGKKQFKAKLSDPIFIAPVIANETIYFLTDDATLTAFK